MLCLHLNRHPLQAPYCTHLKDSVLYTQYSNSLPGSVSSTYIPTSARSSSHRDCITCAVSEALDRRAGSLAPTSADTHSQPTLHFERQREVGGRLDVCVIAAVRGVAWRSQRQASPDLDSLPGTAQQFWLGRYAAAPRMPSRARINASSAVMFSGGTRCVAISGTNALATTCSGEDRQSVSILRHVSLKSAAISIAGHSPGLALKIASKNQDLLQAEVARMLPCFTARSQHISCWQKVRDVPPTHHIVHSVIPIGLCLALFDEVALGMSSP